jgi:hypothetical protein
MDEFCICGRNDQIHDVEIWNPDPSPAQSVFAYAWVGSGHVDPVVGTFLLNTDTRFPRLTEPADDEGAWINPSSGVTLSFVFQVPTGVERTTYLGNTCLMQLTWTGVGDCLDRIVWPFRVN